MRLRVYNLVLGVILVISISGAGLARPQSGESGQRQKKEKVRIVVVEKRDRNVKSSETPQRDGKKQRPREEGHSRVQ
jgi:hypothetical protein